MQFPKAYNKTFLKEQDATDSDTIWPLVLFDNNAKPQ